jgi:CRP-like cAMP-binding protein
MRPPLTNLLLESLSPATQKYIAGISEHVSLPIRAVLQRNQEKSEFCFFLTSGIASVVVFLPDGGSAEVCMIGREGFVGAWELLGSTLPSAETFIQMEATAYRARMADIKALFNSSEEFRLRALQFIQQQGLTMLQIAACNKLHESEARLARWLLMAHDRVQEDTFYLTQEFLAEMLGAQRTTVALTAGTLQRAGMIRYKRGKVEITSREDLESVACDCYKVARNATENLYRS